MQQLRFHRGVFFLAAVYDLVLGVAFLLLYPRVYASLGIALPSEPAYLQASAAFVLVQGIMYLFVYRNMIRNRDLIVVGAVYKLAYAAVALGHWAAGDLPHSVFAVLGIVDLVFLALFLMALRAVGRELKGASPSVA
jgi:hypothetical protein